MIDIIIFGSILVGALYTLGSMIQKQDMADRILQLSGYNETVAGIVTDMFNADPKSVRKFVRIMGRDRAYKMYVATAVKLHITHQ